MCPDPKPTYHQAQLPLPKKTFWEKLPDPARARCRQALIQMLQQVVLKATEQRSRDERQD
jgi:hypothetical protein